MDTTTDRADRRRTTRPLPLAGALAAALAISHPASAQPLTAPDAGFGDEFATAVAAHAGLAFIGAPLHDADAFNSGAAYLFDAHGGGLRARLANPTPDRGDLFGRSVALGDGLAIVGAPGDDTRATNAGAAHVFDADTGRLLVTLTADDGGEGDRFGMAVAVGGGVVLVGADRADDAGADSGAAYLFDARTGAPLGRIRPADLASGDRLGLAVAIGGGVAVVGAPFNDADGVDAGAAYVLDLAAPGEPVRLGPSGVTDGSFFGLSVSASDTGLAIGAPLDDRAGLDAGAAYVFDHGATTERLTLLPPDDAAGDGFGVVAMDGQSLVVGAPMSDLAARDAGAAHFYDTASGELLATTPAPAAGEGDGFGGALAIADGLAVVGAFRDDSAAPDAGAAYVLDARGPAPCRADTDGDGSLDILDYLAFANLFELGDVAADLNGDGELDVADFLAFQDAFDAGCDE